MKVLPIKTHKIKHGESLEMILDSYVNSLKENSVVAITSKILGVLEGRVVKKNRISKNSLIKKEAEKFLSNKNDINLTIKNGMLLPYAGIDESNTQDGYLLYPNNLWELANFIWQHLREKHSLKKLGVIITDSRTTIMRKGVSGIGLTWCGFTPLYSYIGKPDLYNRPLKLTQINVLDSLAVSAVFVMGEGNEQTPMAVITNPPHVVFSGKPPTKEERNDISISPEKDLYAPLLESVNWEDGEKSSLS